MKLLLIVVVFFINNPGSCVDQFTSSLGPISPIAKPFGKLGGVLVSSISPLMGAMKKIPSWGKKETQLETEEESPNSKDDEEKEDTEIRTTVVNPQIKRVGEEGDTRGTVLVSAQRVEDESDLVIANSPEADEVVEEHLEAERQDLPELLDPPPPENPEFPVVGGPDVQSIRGDVPQDPLVVQKPIEDPQKQECTGAIDELERLINALNPDNLRGRFKQPIKTALNNVAQFNAFKGTKNQKEASISKIEASLKKISSNYGDNQGEINKILAAIGEMKTKLG